MSEETYRVGHHKLNSFLTYGGIFLISSASLAYQISLTRIFSIAQWYHFAFLVISIALLGLGAAGSFLMVFPQLVKKKITKTLFITTLGFSVTSLTSYLLINQIPFDPMRITWDKTQLLYILYYYILLSLPFFFTGLTVALAITHLHNQVNQIYFADLAGAASGCLVALFVFSLGGTTGAIGTVVLLGLLSSFCFSLQCMRRVFILLPLLLAGSFFVLARVESTLFQINISPYKGLMVALRYPSAELLSTKWNPFSRVDVVESTAARFAPGLSLNYQDSLPPQLGITIDGNNLNAITRYTGKKEELSFLSQLPSALPYYFKELEDVLILAPMGGLDILMGLYFGVKNIEGIELNPLVVNAVKHDFKNFSGYLYEQEGVRITTGEIRSYLSKTKKHYDLLQLSISNALGASSTGIYGLVEDYLFTEEAFNQYLDHLKEGGFFAITSYLLPPPRQELRTISLLLSVMEKRNILKHQLRLVVIRTWGTLTIVYKHGDFDAQEITQLKNFCHERNFDLVYFPGINQKEVNLYNQLKEPLYYRLIMQLIEKDSRKKLYRNYLFDLTPVTDDRPFFYHFFKWNKLKEVYQSVEGKWQFLIEGAYLVPVIFVQALLLSIIFILFPPLLSSQRSAFKTVARKQTMKIVSYFFWVGMGFMFVEISLIQKFILFLDHPYYAISLVIAGLLMSTGVGSYLSKRLSSTTRDKTALASLLILCLAIVIYSLILPPLFNLLLHYRLVIRQCFTLLMLFPLGILMGIPFPLGIRWLSSISPPLIPWAWCINGCSSVVSSILALMIALGGGFNLVLVLAACCYGLATFSLLVKPR